MKNSGNEVILDTNALTDLAEGVPAFLAAQASFDAICLPVVVYGEYVAGILGSSRVRQNFERLRIILAYCEILEVDQGTADIYGNIVLKLLSRGKPIPTNDIWIAAIALQHQMPIMTRDKHFDRIDDLKIITW